MHYCDSCKKEKDICTQKPPCGCPIPDLSTDCVIYDGEPLECSGIETPDKLSEIIRKLDAFICEKFESTLIGRLINIGKGARIFKQVNSSGRQELRTLTSEDGSVGIEEKENSIDFSVEGLNLFTLENESTTSDANIVSSFNQQDNKYTFKGLKSESITIEEDLEGNITLEVEITPGTVTTLSSQDNSVSITQDGDNYDLSVETQVQSDVLQQDSQEPSFIQNQNPTKVITSNYTLQSSDNNHVILVNSTSNSITITVPSIGVPQNNFFVGFLQLGTNPVNFQGYDIKPAQFTDIIQGEGHNAAIEIIQGTSFLLGALEEQP